ncbi:MAG: cytochrome oxidase subunit III [Cytophagales bacterium]|nr:MAG: cytochrome oxidase subunit III [Cytophagales bacterium]
MAATEVASSASNQASTDFVTIIIYALISVILLTLLFILNTLRTFINISNNKTQEASAPIFSGLMQQLTDAVPIEEESKVMTDHEYDGIRELDNNLPPWWKYMFYATIVFSFAYMYFYHFSGKNLSQAAEYDQELATAEKELEEYRKTVANSIDESNVTLLADAKGLESGKKLFIQSCAACHGNAGEGGVGPNLTDEYWIHGGDLKSIFKTIKYGVPQKGMISWKAQLSPVNMQEVSSYILTLKGTNPPNAKAPQGDKM